MAEPRTDLVRSGVSGLDAILHGGLPAGRPHLVQGGPGTGKTTLALQFIQAAAEAGERCLYASLAEAEDEVRQIAASHGWTLEDVPIHHQGPVGVDGEAQTVLHPAELELPATMDALFERVEAVRPRRLVIDSLSELRILAREPRWFRRELMRLGARLRSLDCTTLLLDSDMTSPDAESLLGSVLRLERQTPSYGPDRRRLHVVKMRGHVFETGYHDMKIETGGLSVHPRLVAADHRHTFEPEQLSTGLPELDAMLDGGLDRGTATLLLGPTGAGKSLLALQAVAAAVERGGNALVYVFDERLQTVHQRAAGVGIDLAGHVEAGRIGLRQVDPAEFTPGEFAMEVRTRADRDGVAMVLVDSLDAYLYAMPDERLLNVHLHELFAYLSQQGVTSLLVARDDESVGEGGPPSGLDVSYLADTVLLHRLVVRDGRRTKSVSVYKRRAGAHDEAARELRVEKGRVVLDAGTGPEPGSGGATP